MQRRLRPLVTAACVLGLIACSGNVSPGDSTAAGGFPLTLDVCGQQVEINKPPERAVLITRYTLPTLQAIGVIDKVVAKSGNFPPELYDPQTRAALDKIQTIGSPETSEGSVEVSQEVLLAQNPDLVIGEPEAINKDALAQSNIPFIPYSFASCANPPPLYQNLTFDSVYDQVQLYGRIFNRPQEAATAVASLRDRVAKVKGVAAPGGTSRTAAALFVPVGGGQLYAGDGRSMADAQMEAVGLTNVFGDLSSSGTTEVSFEEVLSRNPDVLIVTTTVDAEAARTALLAIPGAPSLNAVRNNNLLVMKFDYTDPPTPLSVEGLEKVAQAFGSQE